MTLLKHLLAATLYLGVASVLAEAAFAAALFARGLLSPEKLVRLAAVAHNVDVAAIRQDLERAARPYLVEHFTYEEVKAARAAAGVDCDLRDLAVDDALADAQRLDVAVEQQNQQYLQLKASFDEQLGRLRQDATDPSLQEVLRQLESAQPKVAKDQLIRILDDSTLNPRQSLRFVVALLKSTSLDKRKKILGEFKADENDRLYGILREMRRALPEVSLATDTRQQLREIATNGAPADRPAAPSTPPGAANQ